MLPLELGQKGHVASRRVCAARGHHVRSLAALKAPHSGDRGQILGQGGRDVQTPAVQPQLPGSSRGPGPNHQARHTWPSPVNC